MSATEERVSADGGKYTVILRSDGTSTALRHGETWAAYAGNGLNNLEAALARDLIEARQLIGTLSQVPYYEEEWTAAAERADEMLGREEGAPRWPSARE